MVVFDCPAVVAFIGPAAAPVGLAAAPASVPAAVLFWVPSVEVLFVVVLGPALVLLPPIADPEEPVVCAPAQANAVSKIGAANHVRFIASSLNSPLMKESRDWAALPAGLVRLNGFSSSVDWIRWPKPSDA